MNNVLSCIILSLFILAMAPQPAHSTTLAVPQSYTTVAEAVAAAGDGDTIAITAGVYDSGIVATLSKNNLTIKGLGGRAHLNADGLTIANGKAIFVTTGNNISIENIEFSHTRVPDENGAGIRHEGGLLTVSNCFFHDNENGILTSNQGSGGELVVISSEFDHNGLGRAGYTHNIYVGNIERFTFKYSYSHHATHGHNIKSRAQTNSILYSRIMDEDSGNASYQIDLPNGGLSYIIGNLIHQGTLAENSSMISYAAEGATNNEQHIILASNTMVNDRSNGRGIRLSGTPYAVIQNNIFDNFTETVAGAATVYKHNLTAASARFVNRETFDYHLRADSPARDNGVNPGIDGDMSLLPDREYVHPLDSAERHADEHLDIGAHEYVSTHSMPSNGKPVITPVNFLLLR